MRLMNVAGRLYVQAQDGLHDVESASNGRFSADPQAIYGHWSAFTQWYSETSLGKPALAEPLPDRTVVGSPVPRPPQIFAVGLNYSAHADESGFDKPPHPVIFTKFTSSISGPYGDVALPAGSVDWEVELVAVLGRGGRNIEESRAWDHVAGVSVGQDLSEREFQHSGPAPQFSLAKSHAGFSPIGPSLVTVDELDDPDDLEIGCAIDGETVQLGRTRELIFPVPELIARLSRIVELYPGDVIFTGTPSGVGAGRKPPRYLQDGNILTSWVGGVGSIEQRLLTRRREHDAQPISANF
ncbi:fumarylacetoacetate hydrolase family protein [Streptomyces sp. B3I8]|uniref:fumarylacetoacetate hydrolase family protein n=1 Tax=Streptomyces sp. B3I8 TaxID=3042303 RepID=UPI002786A423|nr:fumarylacetoacetate hydrolase family protein [Streptomyces sp. B3I8]MDQ0790797.1 2,4-diketo-3-deoxy-L-fuconate hydrolase [Streptomyces sp. B3I8]